MITMIEEEMVQLRKKYEELFSVEMKGENQEPDVRVKNPETWFRSVAHFSI